MSPSDVISREGNEVYDHGAIALNNAWQLLEYGEFTVSLWTAHLYYFFSDDSLEIIVYELDDDLNAYEVAYLHNALSSLYGESTVPEASEINKIIGVPFKLYRSENSLDVQHRWILDDGTTIYLTSFYEEEYMVIYIDSCFDAYRTDLYNTTGL